MSNNRDVKLTLKARDEASKVMRQVATAVADLGKQTKGSENQFKGFGDKLTLLSGKAAELGDSFKKTATKLELSKQFQSLSSAMRQLGDETDRNRADLLQLGRQYDAAKAKVETYENSLQSLNSELSEQRKELRQNENAVASNSKKLQAAEDRVQKFSDKLAKSKAEVQALSAQLVKANDTQSKVAATDERATKIIERQTAAVKALRDAREAERQRALPRASKKSGYTTEMREADQQIKVANIAAFDAQIARAQARLERLSGFRTQNATVLSAARENVRQIETAIKSADATTRTTNALAKAQQEVAQHGKALADAKANVAAYAAAVNAAEKEVQELSAKHKIGKTDLAAMRKEVDHLGRELAQNETTLGNVAARLSDVQAQAGRGGVAKTADEFARLNHEVEKSEAGLQRLTRLSGSLGRYQDGAGGLASLDDAAKLRRLNADLTAAKGDAAAFAAEIDLIKRSLAGVNMSPKTRAQVRELQQALALANAETRRIQGSIRDVGIASGTTTRTVFDGWRKVNNESRTALSLFQRIRGQMLSMIAAYVGLHGVASGVRQVTEAYMTQEAALSRLGVVFNGNATRMGVEMDWLRREANRLGIEFGTLAGEYTKFAVGANQSGFGDESIRKLFTSVSEAARVNKLGLEEIKGIYLALTQMISKSRISAEELRQQLGERLPGAMNIMANALGVTVSELDSMMKKGEALATEENMLKFGAELDKQFGKQLPASLRTFTTELGRFQNSIYNARIQVGKGGLIDALTDVMRVLNEFANSKEGVDFFLSLGAAMGSVVEWAPTVVKNIETIVKILGIMIAVPAAKYIGWVGSAMLGWVSVLISSTGALAGSRAAITGWYGSLVMAAGAAGKMTVVINGLKAALMTLGPIGIGIGVASLASGFLGDWKSGVSDIVSFQENHKRLMDQILGQYDAAKGKTYDWRDAVAEKNKEEMKASQNEGIKAYQAASDEMNIAARGLISGMARNSMGKSPELDKFLVGWEKKYQSFLNNMGKHTATELQDMMKLVAEAGDKIADPVYRELLGKFRDSIEKTLSVGSSNSQIVVTLEEVGVKVEDANKFAERFPTTFRAIADGSEGATDALKKFKGEVNDSFIKPLEEALREAGAFGDGIKEIDLEKKLKDPFTGAETSVGSLLNRLDALKRAMPELAAMFKAFADDQSLEKLESRLSWLKLIPGFSAMIDKLVGGKLSGMLSGDSPMSSEDFRKSVGTARGDDLQKLVVATSRLAESMGLSAKDLLTAMSYETGGTLDKWKRGPTTKWGTHHGLIQWGEPQAAQYGVTATSTIEEQVAAIGKYLQDKGVKKGMGLLEIYAAINAGGVENIHLSDAHAGGMPGTVLDKVQSNQMGQHAKNAEGLLKTFGQLAEYGERLGEQDAEAAKAAEKATEEARKKAEAKASEFASNDEANRLEQMRLDGKEREAFIQEKINAFVKEHGALSAEETARLREQYGLLYDKQNAKSAEVQKQEAIKKHQEEINRLETERNALIEQREILEGRGDVEGVAAVDEKLVGINANLTAAIDRFIAFWQAAGGPEAAGAIAALEATKMKLGEVKQQALLTAKSLNEQVAGGIGDAFSAFAEAIGKGENGLKSFRDAFLKFAADFLIQIGKMIVQQTMLNMLQGAGGGGGFGGMLLGGLRAITSGIFHTGKAAGASGNGVSRSVPAALFAGAPRFHSGKLPGLRQGEMAAIIEQDEEVLPSNHPRHAWNVGKGASESVAPNVNVINTFDAESFLEQSLSQPAGRSILMNFVRANRATIKETLK